MTVSKATIPRSFFIVVLDCRPSMLKLQLPAYERTAAQYRFPVGFEFVGLKQAHADQARRPIHRYSRKQP